MLGTVAVERKSNEIPAARKLLDRISPLDSKLVMLDALHTCQQSLRKIHQASGADYLLPVKGNHEGLEKLAAACLPPLVCRRPPPIRVRRNPPPSKNPASPFSQPLNFPPSGTSARIPQHVPPPQWVTAVSEDENNRYVRAAQFALGSDHCVNPLLLCRAIRGGNHPRSAYPERQRQKGNRVSKFVVMLAVWRWMKHRLASY